ncbi:MAG: transposase [Deltaproteobacteria bacterium]|nr:transposase [Deltaproteobacteria bacterium]MBW2533491.1 transposase [Deltaproteobacteria bacterium]
MCISIGSVGDCFDNAPCESFFASLEYELTDRRCFQSQSDARRERIEGFYKPHRRHSALDDDSPMTNDSNHWPTLLRASAPPTEAGAVSADHRKPSRVSPRVSSGRASVEDAAVRSVVVGRPAWLRGRP